MTKIEELHHIIDLIRKHDLPLSPILEYAIKEREEQYANEVQSNDAVNMACETQPEFTVYKELEDYGKEFACLSVGVAAGHKLPHKAILLISITNLIDTGTIEENRIPLDKTISSAFISTWKYYFDDAKVPSAWIPFWYMKSESFWHFKAAESEEVLNTLLSFGGHPTVGQMRPVIKYAYFDDALFAFLKNAKNRTLLTDILENTFIKHNCRSENSKTR